MAKHRSYSIEFKRQVVQEFLAGETLHGLAKRHGISRNLITHLGRQVRGRRVRQRRGRRGSCWPTTRRASPRWSAWSASSRSRTSF